MTGVDKAKPMSARGRSCGEWQLLGSDVGSSEDRLGRLLPVQPLRSRRSPDDKVLSCSTTPLSRKLHFDHLDDALQGTEV